MKSTKILLAAALCMMATSCSGSRPAVTSVRDEPLENARVITLAIGSVEILEVDFEPGPSPLLDTNNLVTVIPGPEPRKLRIVALRKGTTSVAFFDSDGKVRSTRIYNIVGEDMAKRAVEIRSLLRHVEGVSVTSLDDRIVIDGKVEEEEDKERIRQIEAAYYGVVLNLAAPDKNLCATRNCWRANPSQGNPGAGAMPSPRIPASD